MFGMGLSEIIVIVIVAVIFLGPDKLPEAMVKLAKFFKVFKDTVNSAKSTFEQEIKIAELKDDAKKYKESFTNTTDNIRKKLTFEELDELKNNVSKVKDEINGDISEMKNKINSISKEELNLEQAATHKQINKDKLEQNSQKVKDTKDV